MHSSFQTHSPSNLAGLAFCCCVAAHVVVVSTAYHATSLCCKMRLVVTGCRAQTATAAPRVSATYTCDRLPHPALIETLWTPANPDVLPSIPSQYTSPGGPQVAGRGRGPLQRNPTGPLQQAAVVLSKGNHHTATPGGPHVAGRSGAPLQRQRGPAAHAAGQDHLLHRAATAVCRCLDGGVGGGAGGSGAGGFLRAPCRRLHAVRLRRRRRRRRRCRCRAAVQREQRVSGAVERSASSGLINTLNEYQVQHPAMRACRC